MSTPGKHNDLKAPNVPPKGAKGTPNPQHPSINLTSPNIPGPKSAGSTPTMLAAALRKKAKKVQDGDGTDEVSDHDGM
jgi:hypothetical protein